MLLVLRTKARFFNWDSIGGHGVQIGGGSKNYVVPGSCGAECMPFSLLALSTMEDDAALREVVKKALEGKGVLAQIRVRANPKLVLENERGLRLDYGR